MTVRLGSEEEDHSETRDKGVYGREEESVFWNSFNMKNNDNKDCLLPKI